jgi:hypothetical protein
MKTVEEIKDKLSDLFYELENFKKLYEGKHISGEELLKNWDRILVQKDILNWVLKDN